MRLLMDGLGVERNSVCCRIPSRPGLQGRRLLLTVLEMEYSGLGYFHMMSSCFSFLYSTRGAPKSTRFKYFYPACRTTSVRLFLLLSDSCSCVFKTLSPHLSHAIIALQDPTLLLFQKPYKKRCYKVRFKPSAPFLPPLQTGEIKLGLSSTRPCSTCSLRWVTATTILSKANN